MTDFDNPEDTDALEPQEDSLSAEAGLSSDEESIGIGEVDTPRPAPAKPEPPKPLPTPLAWIRRLWLWVGWLAIVGLTARFVLQLLDPLPAVAFALTLGAFCVPGWALVSLMWGSDRSTHDAELWLWGGAIGVAISSWVAVLEGAATGHASGLWVIGLDAAALIVWMLFARHDGFAPITIRPWTFGERAVSQLATLWMLGMVGAAYLNFGVPDPDGYVLLPASYASNFLSTLSQAAALGLHFPPHPFGLSSATAPVGACVLLMPVIGRYWMDPLGSLTAWTMLTHAVSALGFVGIVMTVFRAFIIDLRRLILAVVVLLFAYSFYWLVLVFQPSAVTYTPSWWHAWQTPLLYLWSLTDVQTLVTLALWMVGALWLRARQQPPAFIGYFGVGIGAGVSAVIDPRLGWLSLLAGLAWLVVLLFEFPNERERIGYGAAITCIAMLAATVPLWKFGVQSPHPLSALRFGGRFDDYVSLPARLIILFGPLLLLPVWGYTRRVWISHRVGRPMFVTVAVATLLLILHVRLDGDPSYGVQTGVRVMFVLLVFGLARALTGEFEWKERAMLIAVVILLLGLPAVVRDIEAVGAFDGERVVRVHPEDHKAAMWARANLAPDAIVQSWPQYGDSLSVPPMVAPMAWGSNLALHPMAAGPLEGWIAALPGMRIPDASGILTALHPDSTYARARRLNVEYIYAGPYELRRLKRLRARLTASPQYFEVVYESDSAGIYRVYPLPINPDAR